MPAYLCMNHYGGRREYPVQVVSETPKYFYVRLTMETKLAGRNKTGRAGDVVKVPKYAVRIIK